MSDTNSKSTLDLAESIARRQATSLSGLEAVEWLIAAVLIRQFANQPASCQTEKKRHNRTKTTV